ncbi:MAG: NAD-dependent epimerase/dehydratase family protein [Longimicrobiaceae bacterium]
MNVVMFGATGMVGRGALRECLLDPGVARVTTVGRRATGEHHEKLREVVVPDVADLSAVEGELVGFDACLFCLGATSAGMSEAEYTRLTYDLTVAVARTLLRLNPGMTFVFVSGAGADGSERGRVMWARVKGKAENAVLGMGFAAAYVFRPAAIIPLHGITSRTRWIRLATTVLRPVFPALKALFPNHVTTTEQLGRAMLKVAREGYPKPVLESRDIVRV